MRIQKLLFLFFLIVPSVFGQETLREVYPLDDFVVREEMIPMRDGVRLYTLILVPKNADKTLPILIERTPYNATRILGSASTRLEVNLGPKFLGDGYIYAAQDIRGRYKSEGPYSMYRVPRGEHNRTETDETTDAWDTIDWLVKNIPNNGRVGVWGTSYPGWLTLAAMREPHPALAAAVPFNPVVDVWKADDWFHWGAFRPIYAFEFIYSMETRKGASIDFPYSHRDLYTWALGKGALGKALGELLDERHEMWSHLMANPEYTSYWRDCAADQWFEKPSRIVPALHVHGIWDQEDIYGSPAVYAALEKHDEGNGLNFFAAGPWYHGQHFANGSSLGSIQFDEDTAKRFRQDLLKPFLDHFLKGNGTEPVIEPVTVFETGGNRWREFKEWPPAARVRKLYLHDGGGLSFETPVKNQSSSKYVSDPQKPVPYAPRPIWGFNYGVPSIIAKWRTWLVEDQRFVDGRPDVLTWISEPLDKDVTIRGPVTAKLFAETTGTDADWVVKLIDVYPDEDPVSFEMSGFQLMVSGDIFRGRYREDYSKAKPIQPNTALEYEIPMPTVNHTFRAGHRMMVQVQSTWFPLYDRNPQTFVDSIMEAPDSSFQTQTHRIHHDRSHPTHIEFLVDE